MLNRKKSKTNKIVVDASGQTFGILNIIKPHLYQMEMVTTATTSIGGRAGGGWIEGRGAWGA